MAKGLIFTNDKCISCNKCVRICSSFGASISYNRPNKNSIKIDSSRCINCGACIDICEKNARDYIDDTNIFFNDLKNNEEISLLVAPSFMAKYKNQYKKILSALKHLGVKKIYPVSLGADICTWAYLKLIKEKGYGGRISTTCPVVVSYIEHWHKELIPMLMPVKSPLMCLATYLRNVLGAKENFAFIGPCIGKKSEMEIFPSLVKYNITFPKLIEYIDDNNITADEQFDVFDETLGSFYPAPGGLADNLRWFLDDDIPIRIISGKTYLYQYLDKLNINDIKVKNYILYDLLNCQDGCLEGTAKSYIDSIDDLSVLEINEIKSKAKNQNPKSPFNKTLSTEDRYKNLCEQFSMLDLNDYLMEFKDLTYKCKVSIPKKEEEEIIYKSLHKEDQESRNINCSFCGYDTCRDMMLAIYNGFNTKHNCCYSEKEEAIYLSKMSFSDTLTSVMNRNAYERKIKSLYANKKSLSVIVADVNGLKIANDNFGHQAGDRLIIETAKSFANIFGVENVYRVGGDEFLTILGGYTKLEIDHDLKLVKEYLKSQDVSASIGYSYINKYDGEFNNLLEIADKLMYKDKELYYETNGLKRRIN